MAGRTRPNLLRLADALGVFREYQDAAGFRHVTNDATRKAILSAWGLDVSTESAAKASLTEFKSGQAHEILDPVIVLRSGGPESGILSIRLPADLRRQTVDWRVEIQGEDGRSLATSGKMPARGNFNPSRIKLHRRLPEGYHSIALTLRTSTQTQSATQRRIVAPGNCHTVQEAIGRRRVFGISANLYSVRGKRNWGIGDLSDLHNLVGRAAKAGSTFVGINPLHALRNCGESISPYSPVSRLYGNFIYLDVERVPEFATCSAAKQTCGSASFQRILNESRDSRLVDYPRVAGLKAQVLRLLFAEFLSLHATSSTPRGLAFRRYVEREGSALTDFATFLALWDQFSPSHGDDWRTWPAGFRDPRSPEAVAFRQKHAHEIDFHRFVQFELDRQLARAGGASATSKLTLGLYQDLAIGSAGNGSDAWSFPSLFLHDLHVGCPPDAHSATGQDWSFPPIDPLRLRADGFRYWSLLLRNILRHSGVVRIDHVMGLFRQFWIPRGQPPTNGTYVRMPSVELIGILALESRRSGTVVVGEDLGTVPRGLSAQLARFGILSSRVLMFERNKGGGFRPAAAYSRRALVTANTHDLPPLASWLTGRDLLVRREIEKRLRTTPDQTTETPTLEREREVRHLLRRLRQDGFVSSKRDTTAWKLVDAVYRFLANVKAPLLGVALDDLGLEDEPVNLPGLSPLVHPSWSRKMQRSPDEILGDQAVRHLLGQLAKIRFGQPMIKKKVHRRRS